MVEAIHDLGARERIRDRVADIEHQVDDRSYHPGPWERVLKEARALSREDRAALKNDISRVSSKLHRREGRRILSPRVGIIAEAALTVLGVLLIVLAIHNHSNWIGIVAAIVWMTAFQPLIKVGVGYLLGVEYEYAYFFGVEPRFKMRFGDYLAAPRWARIVLHLSGTIGSPLGVWLAMICMPNDLRIAGIVCLVIFWLVIAVNVVEFIVGFSGVKKMGPLRPTMSSGGSAGLELREALEI